MNAATTANRIDGAALEKRRRAIAANAVMEDRIANGAGHLPITDQEAGIQEMIYKLLTELRATNDAGDNMIVPKHQPEMSKQLLSVEQLMADINRA